MTYKKDKMLARSSILHITARGKHRNYIFRDEEYFQIYLGLIKKVLEFYNGDFEVYVYCLMVNHVYLFAKYKEKHISMFISYMQRYLIRNIDI